MTIHVKKNNIKEFLINNPNRIPIILHQSKDCKNILLNKTKFIISSDLLIANLIYLIRKRLKITQDMSIFLFINNIIPSTNVTIGSLYEEHKGTDGILHIDYTSENVFGSI